GMLYTPILVDRMQLTFPSGYAVANILRALTDPGLLKRSVAKLGGGMAAGYAGGLFSLLNHSDLVERYGIMMSTLGAGMIVGARIAIPALVVGLIGLWQRPHLVRMGWLEADAPFRKIGFIIALGTILGAAILDCTLILVQAVNRFLKTEAEPRPEAEDWKRVNMYRLGLWIAV